MPTVVDNVVLHVSLLDLKIDWWVVLSEKSILKKFGSTEQDKERMQYTRHCRFPLLSQRVDSEVRARVRSCVTIQVVSTVILGESTLVKRREPVVCDSTLGWWRFLEICLTGTDEVNEGRERREGREE